MSEWSLAEYCIVQDIQQCKCKRVKCLINTEQGSVFEISVCTVFDGKRTGMVRCLQMFITALFLRY
jgi:hypothetical protein